MSNNALQRYRTAISPGGGGHRQFARRLPQIRVTRQMDAAIVSAAHALDMSVSQFVRLTLSAWLDVPADEPNLATEPKERRRGRNNRKWSE